MAVDKCAWLPDEGDMSELFNNAELPAAFIQDVARVLKRATNEPDDFKHAKRHGLHVSTVYLTPDPNPRISDDDLKRAMENRLWRTDIFPRFYKKMSKGEIAFSS